MKIAIVVGHNEKAQGAVRATDGRTEYDWNTELAGLMEAAAGTHEIKIFHRTPGGGYGAEIKRVYKQVDAWDAGCSIELHFNASASLATGCETLSSGSSGSLDLAARVQKAMVKMLQLRDRGVQIRARKDRGGLSLFAGKAPAVLIEPYFGSNAGDCARADMVKAALAASIVQAAADGHENV